MGSISFLPAFFISSVVPLLSKIWRVLSRHSPVKLMQWPSYSISYCLFPTSCVVLSWHWTEKLPILFKRLWTVHTEFFLIKCFPAQKLKHGMYCQPLIGEGRRRGSVQYLMSAECQQKLVNFNHTRLKWARSIIEVDAGSRGQVLSSGHLEDNIVTTC
jgi:hypothetical protein